jgi:uncharacterized membrane protein
MNGDLFVPQTTRGGHPVFHILVSFPIACFTCALFTDIIYGLSTNMMWADFSAWLLAVGMAGAVLAAIAGVVVLVAERHATPRHPVWPRVIGGLLVLAIAFLNNLVHSRDAWTSVMPLGLTLSAITVVVMLVTIGLASGRFDRRATTTCYAGARR